MRHLFREAARGRRWRFVCISEVLARLIIAAGCPEEAVFAAHDGVDLERFTPEIDRSTARLRLGLPAQPIVCHAGHLYDGRGVETLLEAAAPPARGAVPVRGRHRRRRCPAQGRRAGGLPNVRFEGDVPNAELPLYLFAADALAMAYTRGTSTHHYMSPMKLFEYLAAGRPIISSDFAVLHEVLTSDRDAIFVPPADAGALVAAIRRVLDDGELAQRMGRLGRQTAARYTWVERQKRVLAFAAARFGPAQTPGALPLDRRAMTAIHLALQRHVVPAAALTAAAAAALLAVAATALNEPQIVVAPVADRAGRARRPA